MGAPTNRWKHKSGICVFALTYFCGCLCTLKRLVQVMVKAQFSVQSPPCGNYLMNSSISFIDTIFAAFVICCQPLISCFLYLNQVIRVCYNVPSHGLTQMTKLRRWRMCLWALMPSSRAFRRWINWVLLYYFLLTVEKWKGKSYNSIRKPYWRERKVDLPLVSVTRNPEIVCELTQISSVSSVNSSSNSLCHDPLSLSSGGC